WVASESLQDRFVLNGTKNEYITEDDILSFADAAVHQASLLYSHTLEQQRLFRELNLAIESYAAMREEGRSLESDEWKHVRGVAGKCLASMGFVLSDFEYQELAT
ncbi:MAG: hypothetical protein AAF266_15705, partial [Planctomycetota bacterium]